MKHKLLVTIPDPTTIVELDSVVPSGNLFKVGVWHGVWGFWFDTQDECQLAKANLASAFPLATFELADLPEPEVTDEVRTEREIPDSAGIIDSQPEL